MKLAKWSYNLTETWMMTWARNVIWDTNFLVQRKRIWNFLFQNWTRTVTNRKRLRVKSIQGTHSHHAHWTTQNLLTNRIFPSTLVCCVHMCIQPNTHMDKVERHFETADEKQLKHDACVCAYFEDAFCKFVSDPITSMAISFRNLKQWLHSGCTQKNQNCKLWLLLSCRFLSLSLLLRSKAFC